MRRVLSLWLDGYEPSVGEEFMRGGAMPALRTLRQRSTRYRLDHGDGVTTGLAGEHVSTGQAATRVGRHSPIVFRPESYQVEQTASRLKPFPARLPVRTVVFDQPYFDMAQAENVQGVVG